ncbi:aldehyde dehydrogenase family protein [Solirubrobacter taibaiensis]|nr:aldehyde dehydrogenase family protein [Solirubrobacter taibaiensis]
MSRQAVAKTYKLYLGGAFVRSESGRTDPIEGVNVPRGSRKDVRDAVKVARAAAGGWAKKTAYNRGQVLYRFAEALESRSDGSDEYGEAIDLLVHYAGWTDKLAAVMGGVNPVAAPFLSFSSPEPTGVVAVLAPDSPALLGLVREIAPALAAGNTVVAIVSRTKPLRALDLGEVAGVSDIPGGVLNLISGRLDELLTPLCGHRDVNAIIDATYDDDVAATVDTLAADTVKRVSRPAPHTDSLTRLEPLMELKTAWHPVGT